VPLGHLWKPASGGRTWSFPKFQLDAEVEALKGGPENDIVCTSSVSVAQALVGTGLVDGYRLFVYPVVGTGGRLFQESPTMPKLELVELEIFHSGVVPLSYRPFV
jgi:dihydrofolate reductase